MKRILVLAIVVPLVGLGTWLLVRDTQPEGILVRIDTLPGDGPPPQPLYVRRVDTPTEGTPIELVPVEGEERMYVAPGAPAGYYRVFNDAGWQMIVNTARSPRFTPSVPQPVAMGRPYCAYMYPERGQFQIDSIVAVERIEGKRKRDETYHRVDAEIVEHIAGWFGIRLSPEVAVVGSRFRISGWMKGQHPFDPVILNVGPEPRRPYVVAARPASAAPLQITLVAAPDVPVDDVEVTAAIEGLPMEMVDRLRTSGGRGTFPSLGAFAGGLRLRVPAWGDGAEYRLSVDRWRREGTVFLRALDATKAQWVTLDMPDAERVENIAVVDAATSTFALTQVDRSGDGLRVRVPPGPQTWIVYAGTHVAAHDVHVQEGRVTLPALTPVVRVHGALAAARPGYRVRFLRQTGDRWIGGAGMEVDARVGARYEAHLPAGTYRVHVVHPGGRLAAPLEFTWVPGAKAELPLELD